MEKNSTKILIDSVEESDEYSDISINAAIKVLEEIKRDKKSFMIFGGIVEEEKENNIRILGIGNLKQSHKNPIGSTTLKAVALLFEK